MTHARLLTCFIHSIGSGQCMNKKREIADYDKSHRYAKQNM